MQKKVLFSSFFRFVAHGIIAGITAIVVFVFGLHFLSAWAAENPGGKFWELLNKILANGNWQTSDGTVKNAEKLGGKPASDFVPLKAGNNTCGANQCVYGFQNDGSVMCR